MGKKLVKVINKKEVELLLHEVSKLINNSRGKHKKRLKQYRQAIIWGFYSGMRISEIVGLGKLYSKCCKVPINIEKEDVEGKKLSVYRCSKCNKVLSLNKECYRDHDGDWDIKPLSKQNIDGVNVKIIGKGGKERVVPKPKLITEREISLLPLKTKRRSLQDFFEKLCRRLLDKELSFHALRHGFATHLVNAGRPLHEVQGLMGHSRLDTTGIYLHVNPEKAIAGAINSFD